MFNNQNGNTQQSPVQERFIIVYDKLTKPMAISLRNSISKNYTCAIWNGKHYSSNEYRLSNRNYLILLNENIIKESLANPALIPRHYIDGIIMLVEGNTVGLKFDPETSPSKFSDILKEGWKKYLGRVVGPILLIGGIPTAFIISSLLFLRDKEKIKFKLFFDAVEKFKEESLELFLNGKLD